jgi:hypothetical protein
MLPCPTTLVPSHQALVKEQKQFPSNAILTFRLTIFLFLTTLNSCMFQALLVHDQEVHYLCCIKQLAILCSPAYSSMQGECVRHTELLNSTYLQQSWGSTWMCWRYLLFNNSTCYTYSVYTEEILQKQEIKILSTVQLHVSRLIGMVSHPDMRKIRTTGLFVENRLHWQFEVWLLHLQYVPASKPFDHFRFEVLEAITGNVKAG